MKYLQRKYQITYPFESEIRFHNQKPFIHIQMSHQSFLVLAGQKISLLPLNIKPFHPITIFPDWQKPNENQQIAFNQATKKIKDVHFEALCIFENQYLCIGYKNQQPISLVILHIELNTKGYHEIQKIVDILKGED